MTRPEEDNLIKIFGRIKKEQIAQTQSCSNSRK